jgi:hypothetical protein
MALLTVRRPPVTGLVVAAFDVTNIGGDSFAAENSGRYLLHVKNGHTVPQTVTVDDPNSVGPSGAVAFNPDMAIVIANATEQWILIDNPGRFMVPVTGIINLAYSGVTLLTLAVLRVV